MGGGAAVRETEATEECGVQLLNRIDVSRFPVRSPSGNRGRDRLELLEN